MMRIKGAIHVHSTLSRDGTMTIAELAQWYGEKGYQFLALSEHSEDLDELKTQTLSQLSSENSSPQFCVIPGIEFSCNGRMHIPGLGVAGLIQESTPLSVIDGIHGQGGFAMLAHPKQMGWECPSEVLLAVDAVEIWNVGYDGKYVPSARAVREFRRMQQVNPRLLAVASQDFHRKPSFYDVGIEMNVSSLNVGSILENLRSGRYRIRSRFFRTDPQGRFSRVEAACLCLGSWQLRGMRRVRDLLLRRSA